MAKITEVEQTLIKGTVTYADQVIEKMVGHALQHVQVYCQLVVDFSQISKIN